jgi:hypothetical protein
MRGNEKSKNKGHNRGWLWLLLVPFVTLGWPPFYNTIEPDLFGIPFFYWYQFLWVFLTPVLTWLVYLKTG